MPGRKNKAFPWIQHPTNQSPSGIYLRYSKGRECLYHPSAPVTSCSSALATFTSMKRWIRQNDHNSVNYTRQKKPESIGIEASREFLQFLWENQIAAVAGDTRAFEAWPCKELEWHLHEWLLAGWGMPIGELFDLEELSRCCSRQNRYTFFLSSSPMNAPGAVASPPNALAFF